MTAAADRVRLRPDLVVVQQERGSERYVVVKDPRHGKFYGFPGASGAILSALQVESSIDEVAGPSPERRARVAAFVEKLVALDLIDGRAGPAPPAILPGRWARIARWNPFFVRFGKVDPTRLLHRLDTVGRVLFSRFALVAVLATVAAVIVAISRSPKHYWNSFYVFRTFQSWAWIYVLLGTATLLHEIGHALACRRFGGQVREIGFTLYLFNLRAYTNVTDSWLFPLRRHRAVVSLAGVYVETILWCVAMLVWMSTKWFGTANEIAFVAASVLATRCFLNLFPLLRFDGYYLLCDITGVRNLGERSLYALARLVPVIGRRVPPSSSGAAGRVGFTTYGVLSVACAGLFLWGGLRQLHRWIAGTEVGLVCYWIVIAVLAVVVSASLHKRYLLLFGGRPREAEGQA